MVAVVIIFVVDESGQGGGLKANFKFLLLHPVPFTYHGCSYNVIITNYAGVSSSNPNQPTASAFDETPP